MNITQQATSTIAHASPVASEKELCVIGSLLSKLLITAAKPEYLVGTSGDMWSGWRKRGKKEQCLLFLWTHSRFLSRYRGG